MTVNERAEMYLHVEEWDVARHAVDEYVRSYYPFTADQILEFMRLEGRVFSAAVKLGEFSIRLHALAN
ncbi:hypothetical protein ACIQVE_25205 [Pseudomonas sp. NPDC098747]|uniref:hypothetical protein n=1 Tax=Pseudomonas sp. NPDC098747 TaxID=3364487 RepID=UPI00383B888D